MEEKRDRLTRDRENHMLGGVCAGIANRYGFDPTLVRIVFVMLALLSGLGIVLYLVLWLLLPAQAEPAPRREVVRENVEEMTDRARQAAEAARSAAENARQTADQLAEAARAAAAAGREAWQRSGQERAEQTARSAGEAATEEVPSAAAGSGSDAAPSAPGEEGPTGFANSSPTPEGSEEQWPPDRPLPSTEAESGESESQRPA